MTDKNEVTGRWEHVFCSVWNHDRYGDSSLRTMELVVFMFDKMHVVSKTRAVVEFSFFNSSSGALEKLIWDGLVDKMEESLTQYAIDYGYPLEGKGVNPSFNCRHLCTQHIVAKDDSWSVYCVGCNGAIGKEWWFEYEWDYDIDRNVYIRRAKSHKGV